MQKVRIGDVARLTPGVNQSRANEFFIEDVDIFYNQADFSFDFARMYEFDIKKKKENDKEYFIEEGDVVINVVSQIAAIIGNRDYNKVLPINFVRVDLNKNVDKAYFVYLYNSFSDIRRQKEKESQGSGSVQRITLKSMLNISIPILPLKRQIEIGKTYMELLKIQNKMNKYKSLLEMMTYKIIEESIRGKAYEEYK